MYALIKDGEVLAYPYSITNLLRARKDVCWPRDGISDQRAAEFGCIKLAPTEAPSFDPATEALDHATPVLVDGVWTQQWAVRALTQEQKDAIYAASVPQAVTMRQARLALLGAGMLAAVQTAIDAMQEPAKSAAQITWDHSTEVQRSNGLVAQLAPALGLTSAEVDSLFIAAAAL